MGMQVRSTRQLTKRKWLNLFESTWVNLDNGNNKSGKWIFASRKAAPHAAGVTGPDAVTIVPVTTSPRPSIILTCGYRVPLKGNEWAFPAGLLEKGEDVEECAKRELPEETGYEITKITKVSPALFTSAGMSDESGVVVFARCRLPVDGKQKLDEAEDITVHSFTFEQMCQVMNEPHYKFSAKTWLIMQMFAMLGRLDIEGWK